MVVHDAGSGPVDMTTGHGLGDRGAGAPVVSIVIPTFRRPGFLREALASAVGQTMGDLEILVCDNGGDDETAAVVASFADPRIRHIRRAHDIGMLRNAVDGFTRARGEFVVKLDDDDRLYPEFVARLLDGVRRPGITVAFAPFGIIDVHGDPLPARTEENERHIGRQGLPAGEHRPFDVLLTSGAVGLVCALTRKDAVDWETLPDDVATAYDRHVLLQAARDGAGAWFVPTPLAEYRQHPGSDSVTALTRQSLGSLRATERAIDDGRHADPGTLLEAAQSGAVNAARCLLREGRSREARDVLVRALRRRPQRSHLQLLALACLPGPAARRVALRRLRRYEQHHGPADHVRRAVDASTTPHARPVVAMPARAGQPRPE